MRFHSQYPLLQLWRNAPELMRVENLGVARFEPAIENGVRGTALLDLVFSRGDRVAVLPYVIVQPVFLVQRERTPIVWPRAARELGYDALLALEQRLIPWLQARTLARQENDEVVRVFGDAAIRERFDAARAAKFIGAAPYADVLPALAPYAYATRFCSGRSVGVDDACGANGAATLRTRARRIRADLGSTERNACAESWFGEPIFGELDGTCDIAIADAANALRGAAVHIALDSELEGAHTVKVASPVPADVVISFDPEDAPVARVFSVQSNLELERRNVARPCAPAATGGSSGTILMLLRDDFESAADSDADEARALASRLRAEGFTVELKAAGAVNSDRLPDLVHAFGVDHPDLGAPLRMLHGKGVPIVATAVLSTSARDAAWGPQILSAAWERALDDGMLSEYLDLISLRKLDTDAAAQAPAIAEVLQHVDAAVVASAREEQQLREAYAFTGETARYVPALAPAAQEPADISALAGASPFVLMHAPVAWRTNLPLLARAAFERGVPLVVAGPVVDAAALRAATRQAPELLVHIPRPSEAQLDALYCTARLYADLSWRPAGLGRIARAAESGCRLLLSEHLGARELWPQAATADPASLESISAALERAWNAPAPRPAERGAPDLFSAAVYAYSKAVAARQPA